jgi:hypothetical protein
MTIDHLELIIVFLFGSENDEGKSNGHLSFANGQLSFKKRGGMGILPTAHAITIDWHYFRSSDIPAEFLSPWGFLVQFARSWE